MGCDSSATANPEPANFCGDSDAIGMTADVSGSCFFTTDIGTFCGDANIPHTQWCFGQVNGSTEWVPDAHSTGCGVCSSCNGLGQGNGNGLCGFGSGSCSWGGVRYRCRRNAFNGDPTKCCRRSQNQNGGNFCFDNDNKQKTCNPIHRGFNKPSCTVLMTTYCSSDIPDVSYGDPANETMVAKWTGSAQTKDCLRFVTENQGNLNFYQPVISEMVNRYLITLNKPITSIQTDGANHDTFIDTIVSVCRSNPGACDDILTQKCAGVTRSQLEENINLVNLCGCFMDDIEYTKFSQFGINRICDPLCVLGSSVKPLDTTSDPTNAKFLACTQSICVIDDITINILANSVVGDITFGQACGSCAGNTGAGSCRCYISDVTVQSVNSLIGDVNFQQTCGTPICYKSNPTAGGAPIQVDCATGVTTNTQTVSGSFSGRSNWLWIALAVLLAILILIIIFSGASKRRASTIPTIIFPDVEKPTRPLIGGTQQATTGGNVPSRSLAGKDYLPRQVV